MNPNYPQGGAIPLPNPSYPMARLNGSAYAAPLNYNQPSEVVGGYDAKINPMTGEEIPDVNFAQGGQVGLASLLASRGRGGDSMLVHMNPEEVKGLQALALAHGGSLTVNPDTGLVEALSLKSILPQIAGAVLNRFAPDAGKAVGSILGFKDAAASNVGAGLIVGGITGLVEGDLKKGLEAGLGAYSGSVLSSGLSAAQAAAEKAKVQTGTPPSTLAGQLGLKESDLISPYSSGDRRLGDVIPGGIGVDVDLPEAPLPSVITSQQAPPVSIKPSFMGGLRGLLTPEGRQAFGSSLGGGFESELGQDLSRAAVFAGATMPFAEQPKTFPTGVPGGMNIRYVPGGRNPRYGQGKDQPYYLPGQYYQFDGKNWTPYGSIAKPPGFADGGVVNPGPINVPAYAAPTTDPNVLATRSYIEELNKRVRSPFGDQGAGGDTARSLYGFGAPGTIIPGAGGDAGVGGGGAGGGTGAGSIIGGLIGQRLIDKGIDAGLGYLQDRFFPSADQLKEIEVTGKRYDVPETQQPAQPEQPAVEPPATSSVPYTAALPAALTPFSLSPLPAGRVTVEPILEGTGETQIVQDDLVLDPDLQAATRIGGPSAPRIGTDAFQVGGDLSKLSSLMPVRAGLESLGTLGGLSSTGLGALGTTTVADAANMTSLSGAYGPSGSIASQAGGMRGALEAGKPVESGLGGLQGKIIPGLQTALGLQQAYQGISKGNEAQAALGAFGATSGLAGLGALGATAPTILGGGSMATLAGLGPVGLAAAGIAALGASLVNTKEFGDVALRNYWNAVEKEGRGIGSAPPEELAQGFINFYRTNKNQFAGQEKYGRTGNEDFVYDMTQVINDAVKSGKVGKDVDPATMYKEVVQPWLSAMGPGPQDESARKIQDFMMTDLIHNFMQGRPISNAQVKGDKNFKIVSQKPVYAGTSPDLDRTIGGEPVPEDIAKDLYRDLNVRQEDLNSWAMSNPVARMQALGQLPAATSPYAAPVEEPVRAMPMPEQEVISPYTPAAAQGPVQEFVGTPYMPEVPMTPVSPYSAPSAGPVSDEVIAGQGWKNWGPAPPPLPEKAVLTDVPVAPEPSYPSRQEVLPGIPIEMLEESAYVPREEAVPIEPEAPISYDFNPFADYNYNPFEGFNQYAYAGGGAIGDEYNFGFAGGGDPGEYRAGGKYLQGPGDGMSDDIKANIDGQQEARLADGEFVIPADVVSHIGNGSSNAGAKKLHQMMARVRQARTGKKKQAPAVKMDRYLPA